MRYLLLILSALLARTAFSQDLKIQDEILDYSNSKSEIISKARRLLLDKLLEGDFGKVREIKDYLINEIEDTDYVVFYPLEYWLILYWTHDYEELLTSIGNFEDMQEDYDSYRVRITPQPDLLSTKLHDESNRSQIALETVIRISELGEEDKSFLTLTLAYLVTNENTPEITQDTLNAKAEIFLAKFPDSPYVNFTRKYIIYKLVPSKWAFVFEFFSGYGIFTDSLKYNYQHNVPIGVAFDIYYDNLVLYLRDYIGFSKTKNETPISSETWAKGSQVRVFLPEASLGYVVMDNKLIKIAPFAGISGMDIGATEYDTNKIPALEDAGYRFTTTYTIGVNMDIKLGASKNPMVSAHEQSYWFLRMRYAYNWPRFEHKYNEGEGKMHYLTIGLGGFGRKIKRAY